MKIVRDWFRAWRFTCSHGFYKGTSEDAFLISAMTCGMSLFVAAMICGGLYELARWALT